MGHQFSNLEKENEVKQPEISKEERIKNYLNSKFSYAQQIFDELNLKNEIKFRSLKKDVLDKMVDRKEIAFLDNNKTNRESLILLGLDTTKLIKRYFIATPLSSEFYKKLISHAENIGKRKKYEPKISDIADIFRAFEISCHIQAVYITDKEIIKKDLKEAGKIKRITKEVIENKIQQAKVDVENFYHIKVQVKLDIEDVKIDYKDESNRYIKINDEWVPTYKLIKFIGLMKMSPLMYWIAYENQDNLREHIYPLVNSMKELFIEIVKDSQLKV